MLEFAAENNLVIAAGGYEYYVRNFHEFGCCVCDSSRKRCPCPEAVDECAKDGHCKCHLFWSDYLTYRDAKAPEITKS